MKIIHLILLVTLSFNVKSQDVLSLKERARVIEEIQKDRIGSAIEIRDKYKAYTILKGHKTVIAGEATYVCDEGGPELAIPGSGDVLAGMLAGLISSQIDVDRLDYLNRDSFYSGSEIF